MIRNQEVTNNIAIALKDFYHTLKSRGISQTENYQNRPHNFCKKQRTLRIGHNNFIMALGQRKEKKIEAATIKNYYKVVKVDTRRRI
jgi:hypothetical protein